MPCRRSLDLTSIIAVAAVSLLTAGCGDGSSTTAAPTTQGGLVAYAHCMRSHGVPTFPDPDSNGEIPKSKIPVGGPQFNTAANRCQHFAPDGLGPRTTAEQMRTQLADALAFARCMRLHGFPSFPDPTNQGELTPQMVTAAGIDLHQPALLRAGLACVPVTHGWLTRAEVERTVRDG